MNRQVLSIEQMQHLEKLGLDISKASATIYKMSDAEMYCGYPRTVIVNPRTVVVSDGYITDYLEKRKTFTLQDILDLLPSEIEENSEYNLLSITNFNDDWHIRYQLSDEFEPLISFESKSLLDAAYKMLCWCIENGYIKTKEL